MKSNRLAIQVEYLECNKNVGLVYSDARYINTFSRTFTTSPNRNVQWGRKYNNANALLVTNIMARSSVMHRSDCIDKVGLFDETITGADDYDMWVRISEKYYIAKIDNVLIDKLRHRNNISKKRINKNYYLECRIQVIQNAYERRGMSFRIRILLLSKIFRLFWIRKTTSLPFIFQKAINRIMAQIDRLIFHFLPNIVIDNK